MRRPSLLGCLSLLVGLAVRPATAGVTRDDFVAKTARDLVDLCASSDDDPMRQAAFAFCEGYVVGAYHYHQAVNAGPKGTPIVCLPKPPEPMPSRVEGIGMFVAWARVHEQYLDDAPVETLFRFMTEKWPCAKQGGASR